MKHITNYKPKDFAELLNVSVKTLQRWDRDGILIAKRTPTDRRYYTYDQYLEFKGIKNDSTRKTIIYTRVSPNNQKENKIGTIVITHQDIISILHVFSCRIYGLRKYKKKIEEDEEIAKSIQSGIKANKATATAN